MTRPAAPSPPRRLPLIGAQVSAAGGLRNVVGRALAIGAEAVQIFSTSPRQWRPYAYTDDDIQALGAAARAAGMPLFVHSIYLINLASPDPALWERSVESLGTSLVFAATAGADAVVTHIGSHRGEGFQPVVERVTRGLTEAQARALQETSGATLPPLLLESSAGGGGTVGRDPSELGVLLREIPGSLGPVGVCLDTAHLFAAGVPVHTADGLDGLVAELQEQGCLAAVGLVHLNDCRTPFGSRSDRHENLWAGEIGRDGLRHIVGHAAFTAVPFILETPGFEGHGPDSENVRRAKAMRAPRPTRRTAKG